MIFGNEKFLSIALFVPLFAALILLFGACKTGRKLEKFSDKIMRQSILSNFSRRGRNAKSVICTIIPAIYAFILAETSLSNNSTMKIDISRYLLLLLIMLLMAEHLISLRRRPKEKSKKHENYG